MAAPKNIGEKIILMRRDGKSYSEIIDTLNCSKGTVAYHCGVDQKQKNRRRNISFHKTNPIDKKLYTYKHRKTPDTTKNTGRWTDSIHKRKYVKLKNFVYNRKDKKHMQLVFTIEDIMKRLGDNPKCYLTGEPIDMSKTSTYNFDHMIPYSRGGDSSLENLGVCTKLANKSKTDMTPDEYFFLCRKVLEHQGFTVIPPKEKDQP